MSTRCCISNNQRNRIFILGAEGRLGSALNRLWKFNFPDCEVVALGRKEIDFSNPIGAEISLAHYSLAANDFIINCAALTDVDRCEKEPTFAMTINEATPTRLARLCASEGARLLQVSTDYVFDGTLDKPYQETDCPNPLSHYGATKLAGEEGVLAASSNHMVARVSWVFGPDRPSFIDQIIGRALISQEVAAVADKTSSPSFTHDLAKWFAFFMTPQSKGGIYHLCNKGVCSWRDYGEYALQAAQRHGLLVRTTTVGSLALASIENFIAKRPLHTSLSTSKFEQASGITLRPWQEAVEEYVGARSVERAC